jgi:DNA-directed RNA polymerase subunit K/omega
MSAHPVDVGQFSLPDDPERSRFRFCIVAANRARQIQNGARPMIPTGSKKPARMGMVEARQGLVRWTTGEAF